MLTKKEKEVYGIIYKRRIAKEADVIARILTKSAGLFSLSIKGAQKPKSKLNSATLNFSIGTYKVLTNGSGISTLRTTGHTTNFDNIFADLKLNAYASFMLDLVDHAFVEYENVGETFALTENSLNLLNNGKNPEVVLGMFELKMLKTFGVGPEMRHCVFCDEDSGNFDYSIDDGGIVCERHFANAQNRMHLQSKTVKLLRTLYLLPVEQLGAINVSGNLAKNMLATVDIIYRSTLDLNLRTKKFINEMQFW